VCTADRRLRWNGLGFPGQAVPVVQRVEKLNSMLDRRRTHLELVQSNIIKVQSLPTSCRVCLEACCLSCVRSSHFASFSLAPARTSKV
jgi:hypothetical protein